MVVDKIKDAAREQIGRCIQISRVVRTQLEGIYREAVVRDMCVCGREDGRLSGRERRRLCIVVRVIQACLSPGRCRPTRGSAERPEQWPRQSRQGHNGGRACSDVNDVVVMSCQDVAADQPMSCATFADLYNHRALCLCILRLQPHR